MAAKKKAKTVKEELHHRDFRVSIFGSARTKPNDKVYKNVYDLAKQIGAEGYDIVTGGGPGLMDAANAGHEEGDKDNKADSIGLIIELPWEAEGNKHLEVSQKFAKFSKRLDNFMALSSVVVVTPGGIGTCLELYYTWQLVQVGHIDPVPIIVVGKMWEELIKWMTKYPLKDKLISPKDMKHVHIAKNNKEAMAIIKKAHTKFKKNHGKKMKYL